MTRALALALLTGCSSLLGIDDLSGPAAALDAPNVDAPPASDQIRLTGTTQLLQSMTQGSTLPGVKLDFIRMPDLLRLATQITDPNGGYVFLLDTNGVGFRGYLRIDAGSGLGGQDPYREARTYTELLVADSTVGAFAITDKLVNENAMLAGELLTPNTSVVLVVVSNSGGAPRAGVTLALDGATRITYCDDSGVPAPNLGATTSSGIAWVFNLSQQAGGTGTTIRALLNNQTIGQLDLDNQQAGLVHVAPIRTQ